MKHRFKSLDSAVRQIRQLRSLLRWYEGYAHESDKKNRMLAKLAAKGPAFSNPLEVFAAEKIRDEILSERGMKPDGTPKGGAS